MTLFPGAVSAGWYRADSMGNTAAQWNDISGLGNNLTQATSGKQFSLTAGLNGKSCYRCTVSTTTGQFFSLPSITIDRRNHAWWCIYRTRSNPVGADRGIVSFGTNLTDCLVSLTGTAPEKIRLFGTSSQSSNIIARSDLVIEMVSASGSGVTLRLNGKQQVLSAFTSGTLTGGTLFARTDGNSINGEIYEFGLLDRTLTAKEITSLETYAQAHYGRSWPTFGQVFIDGDSLCEGNGSTTLLCWPVTLDNNIGATYIQRSQALGGTSIQTQAGNASSNSGAYDGTLTKNIAFCWLGTNDIVAGARTSAQILADLQTWVTAFHGAGFKTIVGTILPRGDASGANETTRLAVNAGIPGLTSLDATCDIAGVSQLSDPNNATYYQSDKIHLTDASYALVEALVRPAILAL